MNELHTLNNQQIYRECSLFIFTVTWLTELMPAAYMDLFGVVAVRADRHTEA